MGTDKESFTETARTGEDAPYKKKSVSKGTAYMGMQEFIKISIKKWSPYICMDVSL